MTLYTYTRLKQDGTKEVLQTGGKKWPYETLKEAIGGWIEAIPTDYYPKGLKGTVWGDEEARYSSDNVRNPHMLVLQDVYGQPWDCVGDLILEQTEKQAIN